MNKLSQQLARQLRRTAVGLIAFSSVLSVMMPPALASNTTIAGVRTNNNFKGNGASTNTVSLISAFSRTGS